MGNIMKVQIIREFENCNFHYLFLNLNISVKNKAKRIKLGGHVVHIHLEGTMSHIFYLGHSFYFMKSRKLS